MALATGSGINIRRSSNATQNAQYSLIADNPVFKVKVRTLATNNEQPAKDGKDGNVKKDVTKSFKIGDIVKGRSFDDQESYEGEIIKFEKNSKGDDGAIIITDSKINKKIKLDPVSCQKMNKTNKAKSEKQKELQSYGEQHLFSLQQFILLMS
jgi:hypothetical protein